MKKPKVIDSQVAYSGFFNMQLDHLQKEDGTKCTYTILDTNGNASVILAKDEKGMFVINREYRHGCRDYLLSLPAGKQEKGESEIEAAQRELLEETGFYAHDIELMGSYFPLPAICNQKLFFFFANNVKKVQEPKLEPFEFLQTDLMDEKQLLKEVHSNEMIDTTLLFALFLYIKKNNRLINL